MASESAAPRTPGPMVDCSHEMPPKSKWSAAAPDVEVGTFMSHAESQTSGHYAEGVSCEISTVTFATSLGTYIDSPYHFHPGKRNIADLALEDLVLPGVVIDCRDVAEDTKTIPASVLDDVADVDLEGRAVLLWTEWSRFWGEDQYEHYPFLGREIVDALVARKPKMVGVDALTVDDPGDPTRPAHTTLLGADIIINENVCNLAAVATHSSAVPAASTAAATAGTRRGAFGGFTYYTVPPKVRPAAAFPVRAFAMF